MYDPQEKEGPENTFAAKNERLKNLHETSANISPGGIKNSNSAIRTGRDAGLLSKRLLSARRAVEKYSINPAAKAWPEIRIFCKYPFHIRL